MLIYIIDANADQYFYPWVELIGIGINKAITIFIFVSHYRIMAKPGTFFQQKSYYNFRKVDEIRQTVVKTIFFSKNRAKTYQSG